MPFRINAKRFFLTFPQCEVPKQDVAARIQGKWPEDIDAFAIAQEHHAATEADPIGGPHLHIVIHFKEKKNIKDAAYFDFLCGQHCNVQGQKGSNSQVATYLTKEDASPLTFQCDLEDWKSKKTAIFTRVAELVKEGKTLDEIDDLMPGHVYPNKRRLEEYIDFQEAKRRRLTEVIKAGYIDINEYSIGVGLHRRFRELQYYIWGPHGIGKTTIIIRLIEAGFRGYHLPYNGHWDEWSDSSFDFAYADEFNGQIKITEMNNFLDGSPMSLPCRYHNRKKNKNVPVFILSNRPLDDQYKNIPVEIRTALASRLSVIHLEAHPEVTVTLNETPPSTQQVENAQDSQTIPLMETTP